MKRVLLLLLVIFLLSAFVSASGTKFTLTIHGNYFSNADADFKDQYGDTKIYPEGKIAVTIFGNVYLWGSYGFFPSTYTWTEWSNKGEVEADIAGERTADKRMISGGVGFFAGYIRKSDFAARVEVGLCSITNSIESTTNRVGTNEFLGSEEDEQSGIGIRASLGVTYGLYKSLFSEVSLGFMYATEKVEDERINLGGFQLSVGLGLRF